MISAEFAMISDAIFTYEVVSKIAFFLILFKITETREALCLLYLALYKACR